MRSTITTNLLFTALLIPLITNVPVQSQQDRFLIHGKVNLPDGRPASRVIVKINGSSGLERQTQTDDQGSYQFPFIPGGRYTLKATHPSDTSLYSDSVEADTNRTVLGNRLLVHLYMRLAPASRAGGDRKPSVLSVAEATQRVPKEARKAYEQALKFREEMKLDKAMTSFNRAIEIYPDYFQALAGRGDLHIKSGKTANAITDFDSALKINQEYGPALRGAGFCQLEQQNFTVAARYLVRALDVDPLDANSHLFLGITLIRLNQSALAKQALQEALRIDPAGTLRAHVYMADILVREQRYREAADEIKAYLKAKPTAPDASKLKALEDQFRARATRP